MGRARPGRRLEVDDDGVVWCHAPGFARFEYWRDPESTARAWRAGSFTVGDLGRLDDAGYLFLEGRRDDLVISGGVNVYPVEVEAALAELPGVEEVAVFGVGDDEWGERVCAAVVGGADEAALRRHAARRLAPYKRPKAYFRVGRAPPHRHRQAAPARPARRARPGPGRVGGARRAVSCGPGPGSATPGWGGDTSSCRGPVGGG